MENQYLTPNPETRIPKSHFWPGVFVGAMLMLILMVSVALVATHPGPTAGEQLLTCVGNLGLTTAKLNALESRAVVIYELNDAAVPRYDYRNLVEIRPGPALQSAMVNQQSAILRPRWIVLPGEKPIDLWKSESVAWAAYNLRTRQVEPPTIVRIEK